MFGPEGMVGRVLIDETELNAFTALTTAVEAVIDGIGKLGSFQDARASGALWSACVAKARDLQQLLR